MRWALLPLVISSPLAAQDLPQGCFARDYDATHLAAHPDQVVAALRLLFEPPDRFGDTWVLVAATLADQGRAAERGLGGQTLDQFARCDHYNSGPGCAIDCDGGSFELTAMSAGRIEISLIGFPVGPSDSCGGAFNLAEVWGQATTYRLDAAVPATCMVN